jgi:threonine dehydrogenase-like Zn-dependent dehydrogenase
MNSERRDSAVVITGRERAERLPIERNASPLSPNEVSGSTRVTLISAGTEIAAAYLGDRFPVTPGYAAVFEVEAAGESVTSLKPGGLAVCMGPHRSFQRVPEDQAVPLPAGLKPEVAVFCRMMGVSMSSLTTTMARPPQKVLVTGLGLVGNLAAQVFQRCGYEVLACDPSGTRRELARQAGIRRVTAGVPLDDPDFAGKVALALECSGHEQAALDACRMVRKRGEIVQIGTPWRRRTDRFAHELLHLVFHRYAALRSGWEWEVPLHETDFRAGSLYANFAAALNWLAEGSVKVEGLYQLVPPDDAQRAYQDLLNQRCERLGILFDWTQAK